LAQRRLNIVHGFPCLRFGSNFNKRLKLVYCKPTLSSKGRRLIQPGKSTSTWWQVFVDAIDALPRNEQATALANLAVMLARRRERNAAAMVALRAWRQAREDGEDTTNETVRQALSAVTPGYHTKIATDAARIAAWQAALADVVRPGMLALEIGAGSGILAMLAARAGAQVVSCEKSPVLAAVAEATIRLNGLSGRVRIVGKSVENLHVPADLPRPADMLMLDLFADRLFDFRPFEVIRSASRLLRPGAVTVPNRVSLDGALANFRRWFRMVPGRVANFDLSVLADFSSMLVNLEPGDPDLSLCSPAETMISAALPTDLPAASGTSEITFVSSGGPVNGIALWLRLELAPGHVLEAKPSVAPRGFYARPVFCAFRQTLNTLPGQQCPVRLRWTGRSLSVSPTEQ
jgi:type II protein arginine methyltransferase